MLLYLQIEPDVIIALAAAARILADALHQRRVLPTGKKRITCRAARRQPQRHASRGRQRKAPRA